MPTWVSCRLTCLRTEMGQRKGSTTFPWVNSTKSDRGLNRSVPVVDYPRDIRGFLNDFRRTALVSTSCGWF